MHSVETVPVFWGVTAGALLLHSAIISVGAGVASLVTHCSPVALEHGFARVRLPLCISLTGKHRNPHSFLLAASVQLKRFAITYDHY